MATTPTVTFHMIETGPDGWGTICRETETWKRPGSNGFRWRTFGKVSVPVTARCRKFFDTKADADSFLTALSGNIGKKVKLRELSFEMEKTVVLLHPMKVKEHRPLKIGGAGTMGDKEWMVDVQLKFQRPTPSS